LSRVRALPYCRIAECPAETRSAAPADARPAPISIKSGTRFMNDLAESNARESPPPGAAPAANMVWIPGGTFKMGSDVHYPEEAPAHGASVGGFWMDRFTVTNADFQRFVEATGHVTLAERPADPADYPGAKPDMLAPSSVMFRKASGPVD